MSRLPSRRARRAGMLRALPEVLAMIREESRLWKAPIVGTFATGPNRVFKVLVSTLLSLRTKDGTTEEASRRLFALAETPRAMLALSASEIERVIYPVGFYRTKARNLLLICRDLLDRFDGAVPDDLDALLTLKGVGRKTANLVLTAGYGELGICVDTHVHRISNRWGIVQTRSPEETELELRRILPKRFWIEYNDLLVSYGQNLCVPVSPRCSQCRIRGKCPKIGVTRFR